MALDRFNLDGAPEPSQRKPWTFEPYRPRYWGSIVTFDQTLAKIGWAEIGIATNGVMRVKRTGMLKTETDLTSHAGDLERGAEQYRNVREMLCEGDYRESTASFFLVVHEMPAVAPVKGNRGRPTSSLLASLAVRCAASSAEIPVHMVSALKARRRLTGDAGASKAEVKAALLAYLPELAAMKPLNQDITDAIAVGLVAAEEWVGSEFMDFRRIEGAG